MIHFCFSDAMGALWTPGSPPRVPGRKQLWVPPINWMDVEVDVGVFMNKISPSSMLEILGEDGESQSKC